MAFESTKREVGELYAFTRLLAKGTVCMGNVDGTSGERVRKVVMVERMEHDGPRRYTLTDTEVVMVSGSKERHGDFVEVPDSRRTTPRALMEALANALLQLLRTSDAQELEVPDEVEEVLDVLKIYDLEAQTDDRTDLLLTLDCEAARPVGLRVFCRLGTMNPLLDGGRTANLKLEQTGIKFAVPTVNKINALPESPTEVAERMRMIERLGGVLKYADVADKVFRANLCMIDLHFPRVLAEMVRLMHLEDITRINQLVERMEEMNPLKIKEELIEKHGFYRYKMRQFLLELALGMRSAKIFYGREGNIGGLLLVNPDGEVVCYDTSERDRFADFLFQNTRLLKSDVEKDKYGFLERENGRYFFKLNVKIGLLKR